MIDRLHCNWLQKMVSDNEKKLFFNEIGSDPSLSLFSLFLFRFFWTKKKKMKIGSDGQQSGYMTQDYEQTPHHLTRK